MRRGRFINGFLYAAKGILAAIRQERNFRFHMCAAFYVYLFSAFYHFGRTEYSILTILVCGVLALELVNSSLERTVENPAPDKYRAAGFVKDMAAGGVLVFCLGAAVCGVLLFWDVNVFKNIFAFFTQHLFALVCLVLSLLAAAWFVFGTERK